MLVMLPRLLLRECGGGGFCTNNIVLAELFQRVYFEVYGPGLQNTQ